MNDFISNCFVCGKKTDLSNSSRHPEINLPVCTSCKDTEQERKAVADLTEGLAEGFVCGCI